jgi:hypothetical protein
MNATVNPMAMVRSESRYFYVWMAGAFVLVAFGGFSPTYWAPLAAGTFKGEPAIHIHGMLMFAWTCYFFAQTALVASGRTMNHRSWGLAGISLYSIILCMILVGQLVVLKRNEALGMGDAARRFAAVTLCAWPLMASLFTLSIVYVKRSEVHKRFMMLLMIGMLTPAIARVFLTFLAPAGAAAAGPPPPFVSIPPALVADLFLVVVLIHDWRTRGKPHPVYAIGGPVLVAQQVLTVPFAATSTWMSIAHAFEKLAG